MDSCFAPEFPTLIIVIRLTAVQDMIDVAGGVECCGMLVAISNARERTQTHVCDQANHLHPVAMFTPGSYRSPGWWKKHDARGLRLDCWRRSLSHFEGCDPSPSAWMCLGHNFYLDAYTETLRTSRPHIGSSPELGHQQTDR